MSTIHTMHTRGLEGSTFVLADGSGRLGTAIRASKVEIGDLVTTGAREGRIVAIQRKIGYSTIALRFDGYRWNDDTELLQAGELIAVINTSSAA